MLEILFDFSKQYFHFQQASEESQLLSSRKMFIYQFLKFLSPALFFHKSYLLLLSIENCSRTDLKQCSSCLHLSEGYFCCHEGYFFDHGCSSFSICCYVERFFVQRYLLFTHLQWFELYYAQVKNPSKKFDGEVGCILLNIFYFQSWIASQYSFWSILVIILPIFIHYQCRFAVKGKLVNKLIVYLIVLWIEKDWKILTCSIQGQKHLIISFV